MSHPYKAQPRRAFWRETVSDVNPLEIGEWYRKKFDISSARIATGGSCFAQHIGRRLKAKGFKYVDMEPAPGPLSEANRLLFGFDMFSARYGNIYTTRQLLQLLLRARKKFVPLEDAWKHKNGGVVDPFRPTIEPEPFGTVAELAAQRDIHLEAVLEMFRTTQVFIFTMGLTEAWVSKIDGSVFPVCPGVSGGGFDAEKYEFQNFSFTDIAQDLRQFLRNVAEINPRLKVILTVSPVPLVATATSDQVIVATTYSKSTLRAVAGYFSNARASIDYFPSYEIVSSSPMRGMFFNPDMREVSARGVDHVMDHFFAEHVPGVKATAEPPTEERSELDIVCDEELLRFQRPQDESAVAG